MSHLRITAAAGVLLVLSVAGCMGGPASPAPTSAGPTSPDPTATTPKAPPLPPEPRILFEWYGTNAQGKSILVTNADATASAVQIVPAVTAAEPVHAQWSRDGSQFTWEVLGRDGTASVWIANADGTQPVMVAQCEEDPCAQVAYPSFSPDGSQLLVTRYDSADVGWGPSHLVVVDLVTGTQTIIASTPDGLTSFRGGSWSPDGTTIAAWHETFPTVEQEEFSGNDIVIVDADPNTPEELNPITDPALFAGYPRWHPTEDRILFSSWDLHNFQGDEPSQLYTVSSTGKELTQVTRAKPGEQRPGEASWTPDGKQIIASLGIVDATQVVDVKIGWVDPVNGEITATTQSGAMPSLQTSP